MICSQGTSQLSRRSAWPMGRLVSHAASSTMPNLIAAARRLGRRDSSGERGFLRGRSRLCVLGLNRIAQSEDAPGVAVEELLLTLLRQDDLRLQRESRRRIPARIVL